MRIWSLILTSVVFCGLSFLYFYGTGSQDGRVSSEKTNVTFVAKSAETEAEPVGLVAKPGANLSHLREAEPQPGPVNVAVPVSTQSPSVPVVELSAIVPTDARTRIAITRGLQNELARLNCYRGPRDGRWSAALTYSANSFVRGANLNREVVGPDYGLLDAARKAKGKICAAPVCYSKTGDGCDDDVRAAKLFDGENGTPTRQRKRGRVRGISEDGLYVVPQDGVIQRPDEYGVGRVGELGGNDDYFGTVDDDAMGLGGPPPGQVVSQQKVLKKKPTPRRRSRDAVEEIFKHPLGRM